MFHTPSLYKGITVEEARTLIESKGDVVVLDVRTPAEWSGASGHLKDALLIPVQELERRISELNQYKNNTILVYCRTGNRSGHAAVYLAKKEFKALNIEGGIVKWNEHGYPVVHGE
jgi:phage shock protein E